MKKTSFSKKFMAVFLSLVMVIGLIPGFSFSVFANEQRSLITVDKIADADSFDNWKDYYGNNSLLPDGTRGISTWKAGGVWTDKSVYTDSTKFPSSVVMDNPTNNFLVALSALASNKEIVGQSSTPTDTMLVLDLSQSMDNSGSVDDMIEAANETIHTLLEMNSNNRIGVVLYSGNTSTGSLGYTSSAEVILPLDRYTTSTTVTEWEEIDNKWEQVTKHRYLTVSGNSETTVNVAQGTRNSNNRRPSGSKVTEGGTYIQNGLFKAWKEFEGKADKGVVASGTQAGVQRQPILVMMSDGRPTLATEDYNNVGTSNSSYGNGSNNSTSWETVFLTQLTAAWVKGAIKNHYNNATVNFYTVGLSTGNDTYATGVLNPGDNNNNDILSWWSNFQSGANQNGSVRVEDNWGSSNDWYLDYDVNRFATSIGKNYVDSYWSAANVNEMITAFKEIVAEIGLQSAYSATLVEKGEADLDGYITVQDELGAMMQVKDIKGILLGNTLFSGEEMAKSINEGALGGADSPTAYGDEFVRTVKERLGLTDKLGANGETITATAQAQQLIQAAYMDKQLSYNATTGAYSNFIGWYGDENNAYLGFWDKDTGLTAAGAPTGAKYINQSYGYLGGASSEEGSADMMHIVVMVRTEINTGHQTVLFKIPSSLIPMVEYKVELDGDSLETATDITLTVTESDPIRLVYEVGLPDDVNNINIDRKVAEYLAKDSSNHIHKDANGNYVFYANGWDDNHDDVAPIISDLTDAQKEQLTKYVAESHFVPNTVNERFYVQEDSVIYTKSGNNYIPVTSAIDTKNTYYFPRTIVSIVNGTARAITQYEQLQPATVANANNFRQNGQGQWEIKAGTIRQQLSNVALKKDENKTGTLANTDQLWVNVIGNNPSDFNVYSFLGNNGKLTVTPATGIKVTKNVTELADGASANEKFPITVTLETTVSNPVITDAEGNLLTDYTSQTIAGKTAVTLYLANGESAVISGLPAGVDYTVTEAAHRKYNATYTGAAATVANAIVENTVTNSPLQPGGLYITKEVEHAFGGEVFPTDKEFSFEVEFKDMDGNAIANTKFDLENNHEPTLKELTTDANGVMRGKLRHSETVYIKGIPAGATVTVKEIDEANDNYTIKSYRSRNHSGADHDSDSVVTITSDQNATVVVTNTYTPDKVGVDISFSGTKNFDATEINVDSDFTFKLREYKNGQWSDVEGKTVKVVKGENASKAFAFTPLALEFDKPGVHSYQIIEVKGTNTDITYDRSIYTFSVNVVIDSHGDLQAEVVGHNLNLSGDSTNGYVIDTVFTNYYHKTATSIEINKTVEDKANSGKTPAGFVIEAYEATVDANDNWVLGSLIGSTVTDAQGKALLVRNYDNTDFINNDTDNDNLVTYHFIIKEKDTQLNGWIYDDTEYRVTVVLTKAADESISADFNIVKVTSDGQKTDMNVHGDTATVNFANTYSPKKAEIDLNVTPTVLKKLEGRALKADEFTFAIFKNGEAKFDANGMLTNIEKAIATGTNDAQGNVTFAPASLNFSEIGKSEYDIIEVKGSLGGVTYDSTIYDMVVEVSDDGNGALKAVHYFEDSVTKQVTFQNNYSAQPTEVVIEGVKSIKVNSGVKLLTADMFTFGLYENGAKKAEAKNLANGSFSFDAIEYTLNDAGRVFTYEIREEIPDEAVLIGGKYVLNGITYSEARFTVTVEVVDNGDGTLSTVVNNNGASNISFVNTYNSTPASVKLNGSKVLDGRNLQNGEYSFILHKSNATFTEKTSVVQQNGADFVTNDVNGDFTFNIENLGMGYHYYILSEIIPDQRAAGISYDANAYHITVQVSDSGNGQMNAVVSVTHTGQPNVSNPPIVFKNVYSPEPGELPLDGTKTYNGGKTLENDVFSVGLYDASGDLLQTAPIKANGSFAFENLRYQASDVGITYVYTIKEILPNGATDNGDGTFTFGSNIYDGSVYTLTVSISDNDKDGALEIHSVLTKGGATANDITFTNTFVPDRITYKLIAEKTYEKGLKGDDFEFALVSADNKTNINQVKKNATDGKVEFDAIPFSQAGSYKFTVKEINKILGFIRYSVAEYDVTITVVNENGVLRASDIQIKNTKNTGEENLEFVNVYVMDGEDEITLRGEKKLTGGRTKPNDEEFEFGLFDAEGKLIEAVKNDANGNFEFSTLKFDEKDVPINGSKQITYTVKEIKGTDIRVTYDETVYTVVVTVKDNNQGGVTASYTLDKAGEITFTNVYTPKPADISVDFDVEKTVVNKGSEKIGPEGFEFLLDALADGVADITSKTDENGKAKFSLTFTEDDIGETYTYKLTEVHGGKANVTYSNTEYTITVAIELNKKNELVATLTKNGETVPTVVAEFENIYDYTPVPEPEYPDSPQTGDNTNLNLWIALLFVSGGGIIGTTLYGRKKRIEES